MDQLFWDAAFWVLLIGIIWAVCRDHDGRNESGR
jgi:hypothetical protein